MLQEDDAARKVRSRDRAILIGDGAAEIGVQPCDEAKQRGFSATAGADDANELAGRDIEFDIVQYLERPLRQVEGLAHGREAAMRPQRRD